MDNKLAGERLAKRIAGAGVCSRREAEVLICDGRVKVNGARVVTPAFNVSESDVVLVDNKPIAKKEEAKLWLYHKPAGLVTSHKDPQGRPTVFAALPKHLGRVISVGRLDLNSEGLLLLTNDGALSRKLELPSTGWIRRYRVRVHGTILPKMLDEMRKGLTIDGVHYQPMQVKFESDKVATNRWLEVAITEGKNREVRKIFEHFDLFVNRLIRISYGPFQLGSLRLGEVKDVPDKVVRSSVKSG